VPSQTTPAMIGKTLQRSQYGKGCGRNGWRKQTQYERRNIVYGEYARFGFLAKAVFFTLRCRATRAGGTIQRTWGGNNLTRTPDPTRLTMEGQVK